MSHADRWRIALLPAPALVLAGVGLSHPQDLTPVTAPWWTTMHIILLPLFPLLGASLWLLLRGATGPLAWVARSAIYGYATFYGALDVLAGVATGSLVVAGIPEDSPAVRGLFAVGNDLGGIGVWCFVLAVALTSVALVARWRMRALLGSVLLVGGTLLFRGAHIYWPRGVLAMVVLAVALALLGTLPALTVAQEAGERAPRRRQSSSLLHSP